MKGEHVAALAFMLVVFALVGACERARWNECRRIHPFWYCAMQAGK